MDKQTRLRIKNEATGMRVVAQYVQEFWECGWEPTDARNDFGIDGRIIMKKKGVELGAHVNVQIKCGPGYISSYNDDYINISIDNEEGLQLHLDYWKTQVNPTVLVFVNPFKPERDNNGKHLRGKGKRHLWIESRLNPKAYWINLKDDNIIADGTKTIISINKKQTFGEHTKGEFLGMIGPLVNAHTLDTISCNADSRKLLSSDSLKSDAKRFYYDWKQLNSGRFPCKALKEDIIISRTGWLHINEKRRGGERRRASLRLLGVAKQIITDIDRYYILTQTETSNYTEQKLGIRAKITSKNEGDRIVQVVIVRRINNADKTKKSWFYSVHNRR